MAAKPEQFIGPWRLVSWFLNDDAGKRHMPMGPHPIGLLTYAADGYMFATLMTPERQRFAGNDPLDGSAEECRHALSTCHSYCGRYRFEGDAVVHTVELAAFPNMVGSEQRRFYRFEGDLLKLTTPPMTRKGASGVAELTWKRA